MTRLAVALSALALAACEGNVGTIQVVIVTAPGSTVMDDVVRARLTLDNPPTVTESERGADGTLILDLDVVAEGTSGSLTFEGFDDSGALVAVGYTAPLPVAAFDGAVKLYVAPPNSIAEAPVPLDPARSQMGQSLLTYGVVWAGGRDVDGAVTADLVIYNVYDHDFQIGQDLPSPRADPIAMAGSAGAVYLFGGVDGSGADTGTLWSFDTNVAPAGQYSPLLGDDTLARSGASAAPLGQEAFLVLGDPVAVVDGLGGGVSELPSVPPLDGVARTVSLMAVPHTLIVGLGAGASGAMLYLGNQLIELIAPIEASRIDHRAVVLPDGDLLVIGGATPAEPKTSAVRFEFDTRTFTVIDNMLAVTRRNPAVAVTRRHIVVAGGADETGAPLADAEVFDAATLERVATLPLLVPRTDPVAAPLANGQILIAGGLDASGDPIAEMELFTPALP